MTPKEYLEQVRVINRTVALMTEKYVSMRSMLYGRSVNYSSERKKGETRENSTENALLRVIDYEKRLKKEINNLVNQRIQVEDSIHELLEEPIIKEIFERKYLLFQTWEEISRCVNYSLQHLHRLHSKNLPKFSEAADKFAAHTANQIKSTPSQLLNSSYISV
ncbi:MAG: hypothetical protein FWG90_04450 [Oscillospiraceae bacterium]|nr:hypothetical protein [Oscillospiraceae bacterium]